jgi:hypothetical protein
VCVDRGIPGAGGDKMKKSLVEVQRKMSDIVRSREKCQILSGPEKNVR